MTNEIRPDLKYTQTHEWLKIKGNTALVGITDHAQAELTDIVFVELPTIGKQIKRGEELCVVESVKSVSEIYAPITGTITQINKKLEDSPDVINKKPYDDGWLVEIEIKQNTELNSLLTADDYKKITK
ncbi:MAG: glycine cleavage system protein GcvH [Methanobacteriota archaeon]